MTLDFQMVPVQLQGLDAKGHPFVLRPGSLTELKNMWMDETGKLQKRYGFQDLTTTDTVSDGVTVSDWHGDILRWRETTVDKIDPTAHPTDASFVAGKYQCFDVGGELDTTLEFGYAEGPDYGVFAKTYTDYSAGTTGVEI